MKLIKKVGLIIMLSSLFFFSLANTGLASLNTSFSQENEPEDDFGYQVVASGVGLREMETGSFSLNIPGVPIKAYLYWNGRGNEDEIVNFNENFLTGGLVGQEGNLKTYKAEVTGLVSQGNNTYEISGVNFSERNNGAGLIVVYQELSGEPTLVVIKDGVDFAYYGRSEPLGPDTEVYTFDFDSSLETRTADLIFIAGDSEEPDTFRGDNIWFKSGSGTPPSYLVDQASSTQIATNFMTSSDGRSWDTYRSQVNIPAGATYTSFQIESPEDENGESLSWVAQSFVLPLCLPSTKIGLTKFDSPDPVQVGEELTYTINWSISNNNADNVVISDPLPDGVGFISASQGGVYNTSTNSVSWDLGDLAEGEEGSVSLVVSVEGPFYEGTILENKVEISADNAETKESTTYTEIEADCQLQISKTDQPDPVAPSGLLNYTVEFTNIGTAICTGGGVEVIETYDQRTAFISSSPESTYDNNVWNFGEVLPGESHTIEILMQVSVEVQDEDVLENNVCVRANEDDACIQELTLVKVAEEPFWQVNISKTATSTVVAGENLKYTIAWQISGNTTTPEVIIEDILPSGTSFISATTSPATTTEDKVIWNLGQVTPFATGTLELLVGTGPDLEDGTKLVNKVFILSGDQEDSSLATTTVFQIPEEPYFTLEIEKIAPEEAEVGDQITYTINWRVFGNATATDVTVVDNLPEELSYVTSTPKGILATSTLSWYLGNLFPEATGTISVITEVNSIPDNQAVVNKVFISSQDVEAQAQATTTVTEVPPTTPPEGGGGGGPLVTYEAEIKYEYPREKIVGEEVQENIKVINTGNARLTDGTITLYLPFDFIDLISTQPQWSQRDEYRTFARWEVPELDPDEVYQIDLKVKGIATTTKATTTIEYQNRRFTKELEGIESIVSMAVPPTPTTTGPEIPSPLPPSPPSPPSPPTAPPMPEVPAPPMPPSLPVITPAPVLAAPLPPTPQEKEVLGLEEKEKGEVLAEEEVCPECPKVEACTWCNLKLWLLILLLHLALLVSFYLFVERKIESMPEASVETAPNFIESNTKNTGLPRPDKSGLAMTFNKYWWLIPLILAVAIGTLLILCQLQPWWLVVLVLLAYLVCLFSYVLVLKKKIDNTWIVGYIILALATGLLYLYCPLWLDLYALVIIVLFLLTLLSCLYQYLKKKGRFWWLNPLLLTLLVFFLELVLYWCNCGLRIG